MTVTRKERREREAGIPPRGFTARSFVLPVSLASLDRNQMKKSMRCLRAKNSSDALERQPKEKRISYQGIRMAHGFL